MKGKQQVPVFVNTVQTQIVAGDLHFTHAPAFSWKSFGLSEGEWPLVDYL